MKKLLVILCLYTEVSASCNTSKIGLLSRLGLFGIFKHVQRPLATVASQKAIVTPQLPVYTNQNTAIREFLPVQPSPDSAVARKGLELLMAKITAPIKAFRNSFRVQYRDPQIERELANAHRIINAAEAEEHAVANLLRPKVSAAA